ncbi:MAG: hypothetical protein ACSLFP_04540 [Acidimicrobiales bacterium]
MASTLLRRARRGLVGAALAASALVLGASPAAAHGVEGGALPAPPWLLSYIGVAIVAMTAVGLRASWATARLVRSEGPIDQPEGDVDTGPLAGQLVGLALLVLVFVAAIVGPDSAAANIVPVAVLVVWWVGLPLVCVLAGDVMRAINPFQPVAALLGAPVRTARSAPAWTSAAFLAAFSWYLLAYHRPGSPRALVVLLAVYSVAALVGARWWGRSWLTTGEGFGGLSAAVARVSLRRPRHPAPPGLAALLVVWIGGTAFDAFAFTPFWADILGTSRGWTRTLVNTVGLVWITAIVGGLYLLVVRVAERLAAPDAARAGDGDGDPTGDPTPWPSLTAPLAVGLVPLATGWFLAHDLTLFLAQGQDFIALLSDPLGRGWDLFGTFNNTIDYTLVQEAWVGWVQLLALAAGHIGAVVLFHDAALRHLRRRDAVQATWVMAAVSSASIVAASLLVLS